MLRRLLALCGLALIVTAAFHFWPDVVRLFGDPGRIREAILGLGPWAPLGLIALSAIQIVLAPVPGYLVQIAGGYLFGAWVGTIYGVIGMLAGAAVAFLLARHFGVPLLERLVPRRLLGGWLGLRNLSSMTAWVLILLLPVGDFCYFLAGLTSIALPRMLLVTLLVRGPTVLVASFIGAQAESVPRDLLWLLAAAVIIITIIVLWQRDRLEILIFDHLLVRILGKRDEQNDRKE
jgi:uncharacterized membrane protein YdjX (TVP38/TMEM64 family)